MSVSSLFGNFTSSLPTGYAKRAMATMTPDPGKYSSLEAKAWGTFLNLILSIPPIRIGITWLLKRNILLLHPRPYRNNQDQEFNGNRFRPVPYHPEQMKRDLQPTLSQTLIRELRAFSRVQSFGKKAFSSLTEVSIPEYSKRKAFI